jgi:hypothetical protein
MKYNVAENILGNDFIPPEKIFEILGVKYGGDLKARFTKDLPPREMIEWCRDNNHTVIAGPPRSMSIIQIRNFFPGNFCPKNNWFLDHEFAHREKIDSNWFMIRKGIVPGSLNTTLNEQTKLINSHVEFIPNSAQLGWAFVVYGIINETLLIPNTSYAFTLSTDIDGNRIRLGNIDNQGLHISSSINDLREVDGLASARKL